MLPESGDRFCAKYDRDFGCKAWCHCQFPCPLAILRRAGSMFVDQVIRFDLEGTESNIDHYGWTPCIEVISQSKILAKVCKRMDQLFGCSSVYGCTTSCPIYLFRECIAMFRDKQIPIGEGYKLAMRADLTDDARAGVVEALKTWREDWPESNASILAKMRTEE